MHASCMVVASHDIKSKFVTILLFTCENIDTIRFIRVYESNKEWLCSTMYTHFVIRYCFEILLKSIGILGFGSIRICRRVDLGLHMM
jgi:hypothetical protein